MNIEQAWFIEQFPLGILIAIALSLVPYFTGNRKPAEPVASKQQELRS